MIERWVWDPSVHYPASNKKYGNVEMGFKPISYGSKK
jgi:hypothetical protein